MTVNRHLHHLFPFMDVETAGPQEVISSLQEDDAASTTAPGSLWAELQDEASRA